MICSSPFPGTDAIAANALTPNQLRSSAWIRLGRDVYGDARVERNHELRCRAAAFDLPPEAAFAGLSAAVLLGADTAAGFEDPVHVVVPEGFRLRNRIGLRVHEVQLRPGDVLPPELPRTSAVRTAWDLAGWLPPVRSVPVVDHLLRAQALDLARFADYVDDRRGERGWLMAQRVAELADGRAQSPQESRLRVRLVLSGLPKPVCQYPIQVGRITLHPDLAWPEFRVAIEYDGVWHDQQEQFHLDRRRLNLLVAAGWTILHATKTRLATDFPTLVTETKTALRAHGWTP